MASRDHKAPLRKAVLDRLKAVTAVTNLVPVGRITEEVKSGLTMPFIRYGVASVMPYESSCVVGGEITGSLHVFSQAEGSVQTDRITAAIRVALDDEDLVLEEGYLLHLTVVQTQVFKDGNGHYHGVVEFVALTGEEV